MYDYTFWIIREYTNFIRHVGNLLNKGNKIKLNLYCSKQISFMYELKTFLPFDNLSVYNEKRF